MLEGISWIGVGAAVVASFIFGYLYFGPLFGKAWFRALGRTQEDLARTGAPLSVALVVQLIGTIVTATVLAIVIEQFGVTLRLLPGVMEGIVVGLLCGAGFVGTAKLADVVFSQKSSTTLYYIETAQILVSFALMGAVYQLF
jgi:ABC-type phosphate/phosphonate transport system permease subunit